MINEKEIIQNVIIPYWNGGYNTYGERDYTNHFKALMANAILQFDFNEFIAGISKNAIIEEMMIFG